MGKSALGRIPLVVTVRDFSGSTTCYAEPNDRVRPGADLAKQLLKEDL